MLIRDKPHVQLKGLQELDLDCYWKGVTEEVLQWVLDLASRTERTSLLLRLRFTLTSLAPCRSLAYLCVGMSPWDVSIFTGLKVEFLDLLQPPVGTILDLPDGVVKAVLTFYDPSPNTPSRRLIIGTSRCQSGGEFRLKASSSLTIEFQEPCRLREECIDFGSLTSTFK